MKLLRHLILCLALLPTMVMALTVLYELGLLIARFYLPKTQSLEEKSE